MKLKGNGLQEKMLKNMNKPKTDDRLAILAVELGLAGAQVLQEDFGFTTQMTAAWLDKMLDKAKANRETPTAQAAVEQIDDDKTRTR